MKGWGGEGSRCRFCGHHVFARNSSCLPSVDWGNLATMADNIVSVPAALLCIIYKCFCLFFFIDVINRDSSSLN